jgi:hypothetical protein
MPTPAAQLALVAQNNSLTSTELALKLEIATDVRGIQALEETLLANTIIENHIAITGDYSIATNAMWTPGPPAIPWSPNGPSNRLCLAADMGASNPSGSNIGQQALWSDVIPLTLPTLVVNNIGFI